MWFAYQPGIQTVLGSIPTVDINKMHLIQWTVFDVILNHCHKPFESLHLHVV